LSDITHNPTNPDRQPETEGEHSEEGKKWREKKIRENERERKKKNLYNQSKYNKIMAEE
jgi:hypothetical protein